MTTAVHPLAGFLASIASPALAGLTDGQLLGRYVRERDEPAFAELVRRHAGMVHAVARRAGLKDADQDDCTQAAFLVLARHADRLTTDATVGDWLHGVAVRVALTARTRARRRRAHERRAARTEALPPDTSPEHADTAAAIDRAVRALPAKLRDAVILCELEGVPRPQAAARLGVPVGTLSSRLTTAHQKLARRLASPLGFAALTLAAGPAPVALARAAVAAVFSGPRATPAAVSTLVLEVSRMMWLTKLKLLAACGAVALTVGTATVGAGRHATAEEPKAAPAKPAVPAAKAPAMSREAIEQAELKKFVGTWRLASETVDGKPEKFRPGGFAETGRYTFDERGLCLLHWTASDAPKPTGGFEVLRVRLNPHRKHKELFLVTDGDQPGGGITSLYEFDGDNLRLAAYTGAGFDRPHGFAVADQPPGSPVLVVGVYKRVKPAGK